MADQPRPKVIVTRTGEDAAALAADLRDLGVCPVLSPAMDIALNDVSPELEGVGALAFTSANGVRAFARKSEARELKVFAVGPATGAAARSAGFTDVEIAGGDVDHLSAHIAAAAPAGAVLHIAGRDRAGDLVAQLGERRVEARRSVLYRAAAREHLSEEARAAIAAASDAGPRTYIALFSPRTADIVLSQIAHGSLTDRQANLHALCLSQAVALRLKDAKFHRIFVASEQTGESLIARLKTALKTEL